MKITFPLDIEIDMCETFMKKQWLFTRANRLDFNKGCARWSRARIYPRLHHFLMPAALMVGRMASLEK
jgi:hypothetical protein